MLTRRIGPDRLALVEDAVQDAFAAAVRTWGARGSTPADPVAWLYRAAWNRLVDRFRRKDPEASLVDASAIPDPRSTPGIHGLVDAELRLVLLCCHPSLSPDSQVALTLKIAAGFSVPEIARLLGAAPDAVDQRLVRAKRSLKQHGVVLDPDPADWRRRSDVALDVLYGMFSEGYASLTAPTGLRRELCAEALRLVELLLTEPATASPAGHALAALFAFHISRMDTRLDEDGTLQSLREQNRTRWNRKTIAAGLDHLQRSTGALLTRYHLEAEIASCHAVAESYAATDWSRIIVLYDALLARWPTRSARLARAVAVGERDGAQAGVDALAALPADDVDAGYFVALARYQEALGEASDARTACHQALAAHPPPGMRRAIEASLARLGSPNVGSSRPDPS